MGEIPEWNNPRETGNRLKQIRTVYNMCMKSGLLNKILICFAAVLMFCSFGPARADRTDDDAFRAFMDGAAGRYFTGDEDGFTVLELPAPRRHLISGSVHFPICPGPEITGREKQDSSLRFSRTGCLSVITAETGIR